MTPARTLTEKLALMILAREGISAIWQLHLDAVNAHQTGHPAAADVIVQIAEAAEDAWLRAEGERALV